MDYTAAVAGFCGHGNELSGYINDGTVVDQQIH
jgi:hypothetical protein